MFRGRTRTLKSCFTAIGPSTYQIWSILTAPDDLEAFWRPKCQEPKRDIRSSDLGRDHDIRAGEVVAFDCVSGARGPRIDAHDHNFSHQ